MDLPLQRPKAAALLKWYDRNRRHLPWRAPAGVAPDPYRVWLSEIMLQQTTVATVAGYYEAFLKRWPRIEDLAEADLDAVLHAWAGLGYYSRARNLHKCAKAIVAEFGGLFPAEEKDLVLLPGIGPYTAAAIAAIAFERPATVVDGNVERVVSRLFAIEAALPAAKKEIKAKAEEMTPKKRPGDYAQAMMDLGATLCSPTKPLCERCPFEKNCQARALGTQERFPVKAPKKPKPTRRAIAYWVERTDGAVLINQRPEKGLLAKMWEIPSGPWVAREDEIAFSDDEITTHAPVKADWARVPTLVRHTFTHFHFEVLVVKARVTKRAKPKLGQFVPIDELDNYAFPTVMKKMIAAGRG